MKTIVSRDYIQSLLQLHKHRASVPVILILGEGVVVMVMDPLLFQGQSLDLQLCALGLLHGLELMGC